MTKLEELINELCPDGVEYVPIKEITKFEQPTKYIVKSTNYRDDFNTPVLTAGQTFILGYTNETDGIYNASKEHPVIIFDDFTGAFKWVDFPFKVKSSAMKMISANKDVTTLRYIYHVMGHLNFISSEHKRLWIGIYSAFRVPLPPLSIQSEIVHILDSFTLLTADLTAELTARQKQYAFYRDYLLDFSDEDVTKKIPDIDCSQVKTLRLDEVAQIYDGTHQTPNYKDSGIPFISVENIKDIYGSKKYISEEDFNKYKIKPQINDVFMTRIGSIGDCAILDKQADLAYYVSLALIRPNTDIVISKYLKYVIESRFGRKELRKRTLVNAVPIKINKNDIGKIELPLPPLSVQENIVKILDRFDKLNNDMSDGLPAEIEARKKQYEYYRDTLLSFDDKACSQIVKVERERELTRIKAIKWLKLGEIASIIRGGNFQKKDFVEQGKPCIHYGQIYTRLGTTTSKSITYLNDDVYSKSKKAMPNDIVMAVTSENIEDVCKSTVWLGNEDVAVSGHTAIIHPSINSKYLAYYFQTTMFFKQKRKLAHGTKVIEVTPDKLNDIIIPVPPFEEQERIVSILDRFDKLCNDISEGLPAEIEARQKQYEYYRDKLLTFKIRNS